MPGSQLESELQEAYVSECEVWKVGSPLLRQLPHLRLTIGLLTFGSYRSKIPKIMPTQVELCHRYLALWVPTLTPTKQSQKKPRA